LFPASDRGGFVVSDGGIVAIIDDHESVRDSLRALLESAGFTVLDYSSAPAYLESTQGADCLLVDIRMPKMSGLELQEELASRNSRIPVIVVTGHGEVPLAVRAMRYGAVDFLEKPFDDEALLRAIDRALAEGRRVRQTDEDAKAALALLGTLTERESEVFQHLVQGKSNKLIGHELGISGRTVEVHRAHLQEKLKARDLSDLVRMAKAAGRLL
jgi:two-component system response regulator FixJ